MEEDVASTAPQAMPLIEPKRRRVLWRWSLPAAVLFIYFVYYFIWQFGWFMLADAAVVHFHSELDSGNYESIWQKSCVALRNSVSHDEFIKVMARVHSKLGASQSTRNVNADTPKVTFVLPRRAGQNAGSNGIFIETLYESRFEHSGLADFDIALESFKWRMEAGGLKLVGYYIQYSIEGIPFEASIGEKLRRWPPPGSNDDVRRAPM